MQKIHGFLTLLVILLSLEACATTSNPEQGLLLKNISIIDVVDGRILSNRDVLIKENKIHSISGTNKNFLVSGVLNSIDASDKYLIPGLIDSHAHLFNYASRKDKPIIDTWILDQLIKYGITGVREMWTPLDSMGLVDDLRKDVQAGKVAPMILSAGALVEGGSKPWMSYADLVNSEVKARNLVKNIKKAGHDFVKVYSHLDPTIYRAILDEAKKLDIEVSGHIPLELTLDESLALGQKTNEHLHQVTISCTSHSDEFIKQRSKLYERDYKTGEEEKLLDDQIIKSEILYDRDVCKNTAIKIAQSNQWQVPTLINERRWFLGIPEKQVIDSKLNDLPKKISEKWVQRRKSNTISTYNGSAKDLERGWLNYLNVVRILADNNVGLLAGTDLGAPFIYPGFSLHQELELFVEAGLTPLQALQTATINPAKYLGKKDILGDISEGKLANLIILEANPLEDVSNTQLIYGVILNGRFIKQ